ncbi:MAG: glycosyltransferase [Methylococcales bacterium]|nr:glycosyltransferase [Methylococcales bacterium]
MKVLHILSELNPSGAETMLLCAAPSLQEQGIHGEILATAATPGVFAPTLANAGYAIHHIPFRKHPQYFIALYRLLKDRGYDSVHIHSEQGGFWVALTVLLAGVPARRCVITKHGNFKFSGFLRWNRAWQRQLLCWLGMPHVAISRTVQETEAEYFHINTRIIRNWYDSRRFVKTTADAYARARQALQFAESAFVIVTVGNCAAVKNHPALIRAIAALSRPDIVYLHVGIEPDPSERELAAQLGIAGQTRFLGMQHDVLPLLQAADLYVMSSLREGLSIAALEAISTGIPVLLTRVPGLLDFADVFHGLHYCQPDSASLQAALADILVTPRDQLRAATAENALIADREFGIDRGIAAYISLYQG